MKRCMVVDIRKSVDNKTNDKLIWVTMYALAKRTKDGNLWHQKRDESIYYACINASRQSEDYQRFESVNPGTLVDVNFGVNDYNKVVVQSMDIVKDTNVFNPGVLYL